MPHEYFGPYDHRHEVVEYRDMVVIVRDRVKALIASGASLDQVLKCNVYCTSIEKFATVNAIYARYFPIDPPARIFVNVPAWPGPFDIEIDCIASI